MDKILFLDIEGVLTTAAGNKKNHKLTLLNDKIDNIKTIVDETDAKIVITSDLRIPYKDGEKTKTWILLAQMLDQRNLQISGRTPEIDRSRRGTEIRAYLRDHADSKFVIIDDRHFEDFDDEFFENRVLIANPNKGLTKRIAKKAIARLK